MDEKIYRAALALALGEEPPRDLTPEEMSEAIMVAAALSCPSCGD